MRVQPSGAANASRDAAQRRVAVLVVGERAQRVAGVDAVGVDRAARPASNAMIAFGERAGLVEADDVDPGETLDRGQLLHEHLAARERDAPRPRTRGW